MEMNFPKALSYQIRALSSFSKQAVRLTPDKWDNIKPNDTIKVALPQNTLVDLRTLCMYYEGIGDANCHFPRIVSGSMIKTLSVYVNGNLVERIDNYSVLFNRLYDLDGGGADQTAKRFLENADPSVYFETGIATSSANTGIFKLTATSDAVKRKFATTSWLGLISTISTPIIDTNDLNKVEIEITFESANVMFQKQAQLQVAAPGYTLSDVHFMINKIVFNSSDYYNLKAAKLLSSGLTLGYQTYTSSRGALANKSASFNVYTSFNTTSLDQLIGCFTPEDQTTSNLLLSSHWYSAASVLDTPKPFQNVISLTSIGTEGAGGINAGGYYNQSRFFRSDACGLTSSTWEINNTPIIPIPLADYEIYNESLIALGHNHLDMGIGVHEGCRGLAFFLKYYFAHICSLEMINAGDFYKSGLDGKSSALNVVWKTNFGANTSDKVVPYIFAKTTRIMQINEGHSVSVIV
jgi:hypothetical protein